MPSAIANSSLAADSGLMFALMNPSFGPFRNVIGDFLAKPRESFGEKSEGMVSQGGRLGHEAHIEVDQAVDLRVVPDDHMGRRRAL